jgi:hypothetical protein
VPGPLRASDTDRDRAVGVLKRSYLDGRLSTETFEVRVAQAHSARTTDALHALVDDLRGRWLAFETILRRPALAPAAAPAWATMLLSRSPRSRLVVGRSRTCAVILDEPSVSRRHALFERRDDVWRVADLGSTNGTYVDGVSIERAPVAPGMAVVLGDVVIELG